MIVMISGLANFRVSGVCFQACIWLGFWCCIWFSSGTVEWLLVAVSCVVLV